MQQNALEAPVVLAKTLEVNRVPSATYRLQLSANLNFDALNELVDYLDQLGISDLYVSPLFRSREESAHGYDVVSHVEIEPTFGDSNSFNRLADDVRARGMGLLLDVVPNHMGINDPGNRWWQDVLANGPTSRFADYFDIDWNRPAAGMHGKILLPFLGDPFGEVLERGELRLIYDEACIQIAYGKMRFPIAPSTWPQVLKLALECLGENAVPARDELESILYQLQSLPGPDASGPVATRDRYREQQIALQRLWTLRQQRPEVREAVEHALIQLNGTPGEPRSFDRLETLLDQQWFRLANWHVAADEINYRRFFDINDLAAIRVESPEVFREVHSLVRELICSHRVTGLRIDHPDGLYDPRGYFDKLQSMFRECAAAESSSSNGKQSRTLYVVAEKILTENEELPPEWAVNGTTGYDVLNVISRLFVDGKGLEKLVDCYDRFVGRRDKPSQVIYESKKLVLHDAMSSELHMLARQLFDIAQRTRYSRDFTFPSLRRALREVIAWFPVYRTYVRSEGWDVSAIDQGRIRVAVRKARRSSPSTAKTVFDFISSVLLLEFPSDFDKPQRDAWRQFVLKFQQVTGPVTAKGFEDTAFYRYFPLASLNEVGGDLKPSAVEPATFHALMQRRANEWPYSLTATATHDTKRGEDTRMRMHVLSEMPDRWSRFVTELDQSTRPLLRDLDDTAAPTADDRYLLYQTLVATWPLEGVDDAAWPEYANRIQQYMQKALRESKVNTSWINPSSDYEKSVSEFIDGMLVDANLADCRAHMHHFATSIACAGCLSSLSQAALKIFVPGVPDFYQGTELWDFTLVDPDNRGVVDYKLRQRLLAEIDREFDRSPTDFVRSLSNSWQDGRIKLFLISRLLRLRREHQDLFLFGRYVPLEIKGRRAEHALAFARSHDSQAAIVVVPRLSRSLLTESESQATLGQFADVDWQSTAVVLPAELGVNFENVLTLETVNLADEKAKQVTELSLSDVLQQLPIAILFSKSQSDSTNGSNHASVAR